jgi:hypothetical protein
MMTESVREFTDKMRRLESLACPTGADREFFNKQIQLASQQGMNYREGLEFVIRMRHGGAD